MRLEVVPCSIQDARAFVDQRHRHHRAPVSGLFAVACSFGGEVAGVAIVGRPVARRTQDGWTAEVTRLCTDGTPNACSMLYRACWRAARALGYRRLVTALWNRRAPHPFTKEEREAISEAVDFFEWHAAGMRARVYKAGREEIAKHAAILRTMLAEKMSAPSEKP